MQLHEQYRPNSWDSVVGQDAAIRKIKTVARRGYGGRAWFLSGRSGTGKTSIARLIAAEVADELNVRELDAVRITPTDVEDLECKSRFYAIGKKIGRAFVINECHSLRRDTVTELLLALEPISSHIVWVFTTTTQSQQVLFDKTMDAEPLLSRCTVVELSSDVVQPFAARAKQIAEMEGLNGQSLGQYVGLANRCKGNLRAMLQAIEAGDMLEVQRADRPKMLVGR